MTVADLIKMLKKYDPKSKVVLARDAEGNGYEEARMVDATQWDPELGELYYEEDPDDDFETEGLEDCVVIWP